MKVNWFGTPWLEEQHNSMLLYVTPPHRRRWPQLSISIFDIQLSNRRHTGGLFLPGMHGSTCNSFRQASLYFHSFSKGHQWDPANNKWESTLLFHCIWSCPPPMRYTQSTRWNWQERQPGPGNLFIHVILSLPSFTQKYLRAKNTGKRDLATSSCSGKPLCPYETETPLPPPSPTSSDTEPLVGRLLCPIRQHQQGPVGTTSAPDEPSTLEQ